ncbi:hypothetical protein ABPG75_007154 [Micractinium tetrahymenae]
MLAKNLCAFVRMAAPPGPPRQLNRPMPEEPQAVAFLELSRPPSIVASLGIAWPACKPVQHPLHCNSALSCGFHGACRLNRLHQASDPSSLHSSTGSAAMHQAIHWEDAAWHDCACAATCCYGRATRARSGPCASGKAAAGLGLQVLTSDPLIEMVYRAGLLSMKDLRALAGCTRSQAIWDVARERARLQLAAAAGQLRSLRAAFEVCAARVRGLALDAEARLLQLGVPMNAVHPELSSPLKEGGALHHALYAGLFTLNQVLRAATHPAAWAEQPENVWDALAASAGISMRPQLVLLLSCLLPVEARLSYLALRHEAYSHAAPGVCDLGGLVKSVLLRMMLYPFSRADLPFSSSCLLLFGACHLQYFSISYPALPGAALQPRRPAAAVQAAQGDARPSCLLLLPLAAAPLRRGLGGGRSDPGAVPGAARRGRGLALGADRRPLLAPPGAGAVLWRCLAGLAARPAHPLPGGILCEISPRLLAVSHALSLAAGSEAVTHPPPWLLAVREAPLLGSYQRGTPSLQLLSVTELARSCC